MPPAAVLRSSTAAWNWKRFHVTSRGIRQIQKRTANCSNCNDIVVITSSLGRDWQVSLGSSRCSLLLGSLYFSMLATSSLQVVHATWSNAAEMGKLSRSALLLARHLLLVPRETLGVVKSIHLPRDAGHSNQLRRRG